MSGTGDAIRVLHVDDEPSLSDMVASFLEREDDRITVQTASDAENGREILASHDVDCIVSDYDMPGQNGIEFLELVREDHPDLPFILYTGKGSEEVAADAISAGVTDYLQKESGTDQYTILANRIKNAVLARRSATEAERNRYRLEQILKTVPSCVVQLDHEGRFIFANDRAVEVLGLEETDLTDRAYNDPEWEIADLDGDPIPDEELPFRRVRDSGESLYGFRHTIEWPDGTRKVLEVNGEPLLDGDGNVDSVIFSITDITKQWEREDRLEQTTARVQALFNNSPDMINVHDVDGNIIDLNSRLCEETGYDEGELLDIKVWELDKNIDSEEAHALWEGMDAGDQERLEGVFQRRDGSDFPVEVHVRRIEVDGEAQFIVISRDITDRKERTRRLETLISNLPGMVYRCRNEPGWPMELVRGECEELLGYSAAELEGGDVDWGEEVIHPEDQDRTWEAVQEALDDDHPFEVTYRIQTKDGEIRWMWERGRAVDSGCKGETLLEGFITDITEPKEREQDLEQTRDTFNEAERLGRIGTWEFTASGEASWSDGTRRIHEVDESFEPTVDSGIEFYHPDDRYMIERAVEDALETGDPYDVVARLITANDNERWVRTRGKPLEDGETVRGYIQDITERKTYEQQLQEEQQFVESIFDALPDLLYTFDTEGRLFRWNKHLEETSGYTSDELDGMHITEFVPEDETDRITTKFQQVLDERQTMTVESVFETKSGERIPHEYTGGPLEDAEGNLRGVTGVGRDLTARKERETQLKTLNETSQELMNAETREQIAEIGVNAARDVLDLDANAIHLDDDDASGLVPVAATDAVADLVGESPVLTEGESIAWRAYERDETLALDNVDEDPDVYNPDTVVESELLLPIRGHGILIAGSDQPMSFDQEDIVLGDILVGSLAAALAQIERTEKLEANEEELKRQNERLEEFTSVVSHDLRGPLSVASGRLDLAREDCDSEHLDSIEQAHARMGSLIDDLLRLAKEGTQVSETERVDLATLVETCWQNVDTAEATIHVEIEGAVQANRSRLQQLVENLLRNAVDHGGEDVTVTVGQLADGFYIEDDGPGIPRADQDDVFEAGYSTSEDGTGFGLNIVKEVVEGHGWTVRATDGSTGGARFEITNVELA